MWICSIKLYQASELILEFWICSVQLYQASELILDFWIFRIIFALFSHFWGFGVLSMLNTVMILQ